MFRRRSSFFNLKKSLLALVFAFGCASDSRDPRIAAIVSMSAGHDHGTNVTYRLLHSGMRTFALLENQGHSHAFTLTLEQAALIELGFPVTVESTSTNTHTHTVDLRKQDL